MSRQKLRKGKLGEQRRGGSNVDNGTTGKEKFKNKIKDIYDGEGVKGVFKWLNEGDGGDEEAIGRGREEEGESKGWKSVFGYR